MKKFFVFIYLCLIGISENLICQEFALDKGASFINGQITFNSQGGEGSSDRLQTIILNPSYNVFMAKNLFIGAGVDMEYRSMGDVSQRSLGLGPQLGYASGNEASTSYPYFIVGAKYLSIKSDYGSDGSAEATGSNLFVGCGVISIIRKNLGISFEISYHVYSVSSDEGSGSGNIFMIGIGLTGLLF
jgi:hypothetical protein